MKVKMTKYPRDLIPVRQLEQWYSRKRTGVRWGDLSPFEDKVFDILSDIARPINRWWDSKFPRKVVVKLIDDDLWNADDTLARIIIPVLQGVKTSKRGYAMVDKEDWPSGVDPENGEAAWDAILDRMIWSFEEVANPSDEIFYHNIDNLTWDFEPIDGLPASTIVFGVKDPTKPRSWFDKAGHDKHQEDVQYGINLFAKYFRSLWT